ncbi:MAG: NAD(P)/FAD-dependent oxidoreductase [Acidimicrobiales bacterium]
MSAETGSGVSLWEATLGHHAQPRPPLATQRADVAIVGGGFTGLWTAYYLAALDPTLAIVVIERDRVGFGASGRNGGWCVGELAAGLDRLAAASDQDRALRLVRAMFDAVDEVGRVTSTEAIKCGYAKGGTVRLARNQAQLARQREEVAHHHEAGLTDADLRLLDRSEAQQRLAASEVEGGLYFAHTAALHPLQLVHGLAAAAERRGVTIAEGTAATQLGPGFVDTDHGRLAATTVVRATEGYTAGLAGERRTLAPLYSLMVATEPLDAHTWDAIGLRQRETFADDRHLVIYGQRTADDRIAFGGRGAPYAFGSRVDPAIERSSRRHRLIEDTLRQLLPDLAGARITHRWGGVLGVPRDWFPSVGYDRSSGLAHAGGYVGEGVAAANLAGRTLAELIVGQETERTDLPWVEHASRSWEPEPLRWLGINAALQVMASADRAEGRTGRPARRADLLWRVLG